MKRRWRLNNCLNLLVVLVTSALSTKCPAGQVKAWISIHTDTDINFSHTEIILGTPSDIPLISGLDLTIAEMHIYIVASSKHIVPGIEALLKEYQT